MLATAAAPCPERARSIGLPGSPHERLVRILAIALPGLVVLTLGALLLAPLSRSGSVSLLVDRNKVAITHERIATANAVYQGRDSRGRAFRVVAEHAAQPSSMRPSIDLRGLAASIELTDGPARIIADTGRYDFARGRIAIDGRVSVSAPDEFWLTTRDVELDLRSQRLVAKGVHGVSPTGQFSADAMTVDLPDRSVALEGHVRLRMIPGELRLPR